MSIEGRRHRSAPRPVVSGTEQGSARVAVVHSQNGGKASRGSCENHREVEGRKRMGRRWPSRGGGKKGVGGDSASELGEEGDGEEGVVG